MGRWWSTSASDRRVACAALTLLLPLALVACRGHDSATSPDAVPAVAGDDASSAAPLPAPEAAPGSSVTGMPTSPPPAVATPGEAVAPVTQPMPAAAVAPVVDGSLPATVTDAGAAASGAPQPTAALPPPSPADAAAAGSLVTQYMASLGSGEPAKGQTLWSTTPNDSAVLQLARNTPFDIGIGAPTTDAGGRVAVPVDVRGKADDGSARHLVATYTVQRGASGTWQIMSAAVRDVAP